MEILQEERTVTGECYAALLDKLNGEIKKKQPTWRRRRSWGYRFIAETDVYLEGLQVSHHKCKALEGNYMDINTTLPITAEG